MKPWEIADHEASGVIGAEESLASGVTVVGDIAYGAAEVASASRAGLGGVYYWELLGLPAEQLAEQLAYLRYPENPAEYGARVDVRALAALAVHERARAAPGGTRPCDGARGAARDPRRRVRRGDVAAARWHRARSPRSPRGRRHGFRPPRTSTVAYLHSLGVLDGTTAVHCCHLDGEDVQLLADARARRRDVPAVEPLPRQPAARASRRCSPRASQWESVRTPRRATTIWT